jgi:glycogen debranching enzyme
LKILRLVQEQLLTPVGLRTLSPHDPRYRARYEGGVLERDGAYHQGTVWPFLLGQFVTAWIKVHGKKAAVLKQARSFLDGIGAHLKEACLGQVSEIFDAEAPHNARGCCAQAWSVAEPLRSLIEDLVIQADAQKTTTKQVVIRQRKKTASQSTQGQEGKSLRQGEDAALNP